VRGVVSLTKEHYVKSLDEARTFDEVFRLVKRVVEEQVGMHRAGLGLVLVDLPNQLAAFHEIGSNAIVLNRSLLSAVTSLAKSRRELNSFVFVVLLHEYLHTLGFDEIQARETVKELVKSIFTDDHVAVRIAKTSIYEVYPELRTIPNTRVNPKPEVVKDFDTESTTYIR